ncbi:MAG: hypothetical protein JWR19_304 [Pedosphaera sp.]|jgi:hypothetical protein|nr:hypothetical protein [Pedosphaera sp.]
MKNNPLALMLVLVLFLSTLFTAWLAVSYNLSLRKLQQLQPKVAAATNTRSLMQALFNDATEYSKKNPAIIPVLQTVMTPAPAARPTTNK